jgi:hypothetical protein
VTDEDAFLDNQFATYRNEMMSNVTPVGPNAIRATVRRRRRVAVTAGAVAALVLIAGPAAGYQVLNRGPAPPVPGTSADPTPSLPPTGAPSGSASPSTATTAPDGRISSADLLSTSLKLPAWWGDAPCESEGRLAGAEPNEEGNWLASVDYADVDRDGAEETVVMVGCKFGARVITIQVAVLDRDRTGKIVTLGQVLTARPLGWIFQVDAQPDGSIRIEVGDRQPTNTETVVPQWRTYTWTGAKFEQTAGPTSFPPLPTQPDLRVTATDIVYGAVAGDGSRHGTITVTISNAGPATAQQVLLVLELGETVRHEGNGWSGCLQASTNPGSSPPSLSCLLGPMRAGESRTLVLGTTSPGARLTQVSGRAFVTGVDKHRDPMSDARPSDNEALFDQR